MVEMDQDPQIYRTQQENFKKMLRKYENHEFWSPGITFQWRFYGGNYIGISWGLPIELDRPDGVVTFTSLRKSSTRYYSLFRLLRLSTVQKV